MCGCFASAKMTELKMNFEHEKAKLVHDLHARKDLLCVEREHEWETVREQLQGELADAECRLKDKQEKDAKVRGPQGHTRVIYGVYDC